MRKCQIFSTDGFLAIVFLLLIVGLFMNMWSIRLDYFVTNFENRIMELKAFNALDLLLSNSELSITNKFYDINKHKIAELINGFNNDYALASESLGLGGYFIQVKLEQPNGSVIFNSNPIVNNTNYIVSARKNCVYKKQDVVLSLLVGRR